MEVEVADAKARRRSSEPWGRTPWFYRGDGCEKGNRLPQSPSLPRHTAASRRGIHARDPYPFPPKSRRTVRLPQTDRDSFPTEGIQVKGPFLRPAWAQKSKGQPNSLDGRPNEGWARKRPRLRDTSISRALTCGRAPARLTQDEIPVNRIPRFP